MALPGDVYQTLGVSRDVSREDLQRAYRKLARTYHPDINKSPDPEERFKAISEAYDVLSDPDQRRRYDAFGPDFRQVPPDVDAQTWARAGAAAGTRGPRDGRGRSGRGGPARRLSPHGARPAQLRTSIWTACSAAGGTAAARWPALTRRPRSN
jgi:curved DNA-binding protein